MGLRKNKIRPLLNEGYGVFLVGYRGYNDNLGDPSEKGFYNDARGAIEALKEQGVSEGELVLYGESIGTGVATQMATEYRVAALILESPFTSLIDVGATHYPWAPIGTFLQDQYNSLSKIKKVEAPLLIVHGQADNVVPVQLARKLYEKAKEPKKLELIPGAGHNDIYEFNGQNIVQGFLEGLYTGSSTASQ